MYECMIEEFDPISINMRVNAGNYIDEASNMSEDELLVMEAEMDHVLNEPICDEVVGDSTDILDMEVDEEILSDLDMSDEIGELIDALDGII